MFTPAAAETENGRRRSPWARLRGIPSLSIAAVLILLLIGAVAWTRLPHHPVLTEKDTILISDFENRTGDSIFDGTLRKALSSGLSQSPYLNIVSDTRIQESLTLMGKPADTRVTPGIALQICKREGIKATLNGSIASFGNQYVVT